MRLPVRILTVLAVAGSMWLPAAAQSAGDDVVTRITEASDGHITIDIPQDILRQIFLDNGAERKRVQTQPSLKPGINKLDGFRIQVFSDGSNQRTLEARARARGNAIVAKFPKYRGQVYSYSSAPNWYTRIGNFRTQAEATAALAELKSAFPSLRTEMRIVKSQIIIIAR